MYIAHANNGKKAELLQTGAVKIWFYIFTDKGFRTRHQPSSICSMRSIRYTTKNMKM